MQGRRDGARLAGALAALLIATGPAWASRHGVEEAEILEPGQCELELAFARAQGTENQFPTEASCRVGAVQLNGELEHDRTRAGSDTATAAEVKWARELAGGWHAGVLLRAQFAAHQRPHHDANAIVALLGYELRDDLELHLNLGRAFLHGGGHLQRSGVGVEWQLLQDWTLVAERYAQDGTHFFRGTARWAGGRNWTLEAGRAQRLAGPDPSRWTIQVNIRFGDE